MIKSHNKTSIKRYIDISSRYYVAKSNACNINHYRNEGRGVSLLLHRGKRPYKLITIRAGGNINLRNSTLCIIAMNFVRLLLKGG